MSHTMNQMLELARWDAGPARRRCRQWISRSWYAAELEEISPRAVDKDLEIVSNADKNAPRIEGWEPGLPC